MKNRIGLFAWAVLSGAAAALLASCGGGGGDASAPTGQQTVVGTITAFGSVVVNGVHFDDSETAVTMNGDAASRDRLRVGMVVRVQGEVRGDNTGIARNIAYDDCMIGPITAMNRVQNTVSVMGVPVLVDDNTVFDGVALRDMGQFAIGDLVAVSCMQEGATTRLRAQRMERLGAFQSGASDLLLAGTVAGLDTSARTLTIGGGMVKFADIPAGALPSGLANGMSVQVHGRAYADGVLTADRLRDRDRTRDRLSDGALLQLEGYVSQFVSLSNFTVGDQLVNAADAVVRNGTAADIVNGVKVEVEGSIRNGVLVASLVIIRQQPQCNIQLQAGLQAKDAASNTLKLLGRSIRVTADSEMRDRLASATHPTLLTFAALNIADRVEVSACAAQDGSLIAWRVERTPPAELVVVKGLASAKTPTTQLTIAGVPVDTGAATRYRDASGNVVDAATFYGQLQVPPATPSMVNARGVVPNLAATVVDATRAASVTGEVELRD